MEGRIRAIFVLDDRNGPNTEVETALLRRDYGIEGDTRGGEGSERQITVLSMSAIEAFKTGEPPQDLGDLGVNLITHEIDLNSLELGRRIRLGPHAVGQIVQFGWTCQDSAGPDRHRPESRLRRKHGVILRVARSGEIKRGDAITTSERLDSLRFAVITSSDRAARGETEDLSGPLIGRLIREQLPAVEISYRVVPDDEIQLASHLMSLCDEQLVDLVLTTGGTGLSPRDRTPEATRRVIDREIPGIAEAIRAEGLKHTPHAMLSRAVVGLRGRTLIVNLSGSPRAVREQLDTVLPILPHAVEVAAGVKVSCARS